MKKIYLAGIIGCGGISHSHAQGYVSCKRTELVAAADINPAQLEKYAEQYKLSKEHLYTNHIEMLEKENLDLVSVCTWPGLHAPCTIDAAKRGVKGIICEKPMAPDMKQADAMVEACDQNGTKLAIGHQLRFGGIYEKTRELVQTGAIGQLTKIHGVCEGGDLKDNATHTVDLMRFFAQDEPIEWVIGQIDRRSKPSKYALDSEDFAIGYWKFASGVRGFIESGRFTMKGYHHIYLYGTDGEIELHAPGAPALRMRSKTTKGEWITPEAKSTTDPVQDLVDAIEENREHRSSGRQGRAALEVLMAIYESSRIRALIELPLTTKESPLTLMIQAGQI